MVMPPAAGGVGLFEPLMKEIFPPPMAGGGQTRQNRGSGSWSAGINHLASGLAELFPPANRRSHAIFAWSPLLKTNRRTGPLARPDQCPLVVKPLQLRKSAKICENLR